MGRQITYQDSDAAIIVAEDTNLDSSHAMLESLSAYSIVMNLLGIDVNDLGVRVNLSKREIVVLARKESRNMKRGFFWVFGVPPEGLLEAMTTQFKSGVLEIVIPKYPQHSFESAV